MSTIEKMSIFGIRSFGIEADDEQVSYEIHTTNNILLIINIFYF